MNSLNNANNVANNNHYVSIEEKMFFKKLIKFLEDECNITLVSKISW